MAEGRAEGVTRLLETLSARQEPAEHQFFEAMYSDLHRLARFLMAREPPSHTLQATALVNEAYLKLVGGDHVDWTDQRHFVNTVARAMRQVLADRARRYGRAKHGADHHRVELADFDSGAAPSFPLERSDELEDAISRMGEANPRWQEIVHLRFFAGLSIEQTAAVMQISTALVKKDWKFARAWLLNALNAVGAR